MTIGLTCRRTARRIKRLKGTVLTISPDYSDRPTPDFLALSIGKHAIRVLIRNLGKDLQEQTNSARRRLLKGDILHLGPKRSLAIMTRPQRLQVRILGWNRRPRGDFISKINQAAQVPCRVMVVFGLGTFENRLEQSPI